MAGRKRRHRSNLEARRGTLGLVVSPQTPHGGARLAASGRSGRANETPTAGRAKSLPALAKLGMFLGSEQAAAHAAESLAVWTELGDIWRAADARLALGMALATRAITSGRRRCWKTWPHSWTRRGEPARAAVALCTLGRLLTSGEWRAGGSPPGGGAEPVPPWRLPVGDVRQPCSGSARPP